MAVYPNSRRRGLPPRVSLIDHQRQELLRLLRQANLERGLEQAIRRAGFEFLTDQVEDMGWRP